MHAVLSISKNTSSNCCTWAGKSTIQNLILHISQQNPKASSIHYPESNTRVLFKKVKNSTFKGEGTRNSGW